MMMEDLVNEAERLTAEIAGAQAFPRVERNLKQLSEAGQELWNRTSADSSSAPTATRQAAQVSASILLGSRGYDLTKVTQQLESLASRKQLVQQEPQTGKEQQAVSEPMVRVAARDPAVQSFLRNERESAILSAVENVKKKTVDLVDSLFWESVKQDWQEEKMRILNTTLTPDTASSSGRPDTAADGSFLSSTLLDQTMASARSIYPQQQPYTPMSTSTTTMPAAGAADTSASEAGEGRKIVDSVMQLMRQGKPYDHIVGCMQMDGCRRPGSLDRLRLSASGSPNVDALIEEIAVIAEKEAFLLQAVKLYDLCGIHSKSLEILNRLLANVLSYDPATNPQREEVEQVALVLAERYSVQGHSAGKQVASTFFLLLDLMTFFTYYHRQSFNDALDTMSKLNLLPLSQSELDARVQDFKKMSIEIQRNVPDLLIACMNILYAQYRETKVATVPAVQKFGLGSPEFGNRDQRLTEIREKGRTLITFAGMIPYRMTAEINAKLVQLEVLMN